MKTERIKIDGIPATMWGEGSDRVWIAVHGNLSHKEDEVVRLLAEAATEKGYGVLSFDLPEHGERKGDPTYLCKVQNCVRDLKTVLAYAKANFREMNLWACSMGAYFSLLAYRDEPIEKCLFLSPVEQESTLHQLKCKTVLIHCLYLSNRTIRHFRMFLPINIQQRVVLCPINSQ